MTDMAAKDTSEPKAGSSVQTLDPHPEPDSEAQAGFQILNQSLSPMQDPDTSQWTLLQPVLQFNNQVPTQAPAGNISTQAQPATVYTQAHASTQTTTDSPQNDTQTTTGNPQNDDGHIEADDIEALERDSAFGDNGSIASSRTSLLSGITKYRQEHGRTYHAYKDGKYLFPNDEKEQDRLDLFHHVFTLLFDGKLFHAPIKNPHRVLDAGTGTGIWAIEFADQFEAAHVIGSDLSPIQPGWIPPNLEFEVDDIEETWRHKPFDFIHMRMLAGAIKDWPALIAQAYDHLAPGGWLEFCEFEVWVECQNEVKVPFMIQKWQTLLQSAGEKIGRTFVVAVHQKEWLENAGFVNVHEDVIKVPNSPWAKDRRWKEIGLYQQQNMLDAASSYGQAHFTRVLGWTVEEFQVLSAGVRKELKDLKYHLRSNLHVVYGQKPGGDTK